MNERPIIFSAPMVKAILEGRKTQTRRALKPKYQAAKNHRKTKDCGIWAADADPISYYFSCPYGVAGDRLWVRETWQVNKVYDPLGARLIYQAMGGDVRGCVHYCADKDVNWAGRKRPSIHMPRWASRITLEITGVRVERLQEITNRDAESEGLVARTVDFGMDDDPRFRFRKLWDSLHGKGAWELNPFVWVLEFKRA